MKNIGFVIGWILSLIIMPMIGIKLNIMTWLIGVVWILIWVFSNWKIVAENNKIFIRKK